MDETQVPSHIGAFLLRDKLGFGAFSSVYKAIDTNTQLPVAIKIITKTNFEEGKLKREVDLLKMLDHPFCVSFFELIEDEKFYYLVMEYVEGRTVFKLINTKGPLPEWLCRHIFCQLISALEYLHEEKKLVHRDLKAENIMLDKCGNIRLIDFGLGNQFANSEALLQTACGSPAYAPPEMFKGQTYNATADLWSAGVVLYAMSVGKLPFEDIHITKLVSKIISSEPEYPETLSPILVDLLHRMLMKDASCRMSLQKIRAHQWFLPYHFASMMNADFGICQGFRMLDEGEADIMIMNQLDQLGLDSTKLYELAKQAVFSSEVTPYRILHRNHISNKMRGMYSTAEKSESMQAVPSLSRPPVPNRSNPLMSIQIESTFRRPSQALQRKPLSLSMVENNYVKPESTSLAGTKNKAESQSMKNSVHYKAAALNTLTRLTPMSQRRQRPRGLSFGPEGNMEPIIPQHPNEI